MLDGLLGRKFSAKCKHSVKSMGSRINLIRKKKHAMLNFLKKDIADLLANGHETNAFGRMDGLIVDMNQICCYDMIEHFSQCILADLMCLQKQRECPQEDVEAVATLIFAAARFSDLPELCDLRHAFTARYGNEIESCVNKEFAAKIATKSFPKDVKLSVMQDIAREFSIEWDIKLFGQTKPKTSSLDRSRSMAVPLRNDKKEDTFMPINERKGVVIDNRKQEFSPSKKPEPAHRGILLKSTTLPSNVKLEAVNAPVSGRNAAGNGMEMQKPYSNEQSGPAFKGLVLEQDVPRCNGKWQDMSMQSKETIHTEKSKFSSRDGAIAAPIDTVLKQEIHREAIRAISHSDSGFVSDPTKKIGRKAFYDEPENVNPEVTDSTLPPYIKPQSIHKVPCMEYQHDARSSYRTMTPRGQQGGDCTDSMFPPYTKPRSTQKGPSTEDQHDARNSYKTVTPRAQQGWDHTDSTVIPYMKQRSICKESYTEDQHGADSSYRKMAPRAQQGWDHTDPDIQTVRGLKPRQAKSNIVDPPYLEPNAYKNGSQVEDDERRSAYSDSKFQRGFDYFALEKQAVGLAKSNDGVKASNVVPRVQSKYNRSVGYAEGSHDADDGYNDFIQQEGMDRVVSDKQEFGAVKFNDKSAINRAPFDKSKTYKNGSSKETCSGNDDSLNRLNYHQGSDPVFPEKQVFGTTKFSENPTINRIPPYIKSNGNMMVKQAEDIKNDDTKHERSIEGHGRSKSYSNGHLEEDDFSGDRKPEPLSVRRKHLKPPTALQKEDSTYNDVAEQWILDGQGHGARQNTPTLDIGYNSEKHGFGIAEYDRFNSHGNGEFLKDDFAGGRKPEQQSNRRKHIRPPTSSDSVNITEGVPQSRRPGERRYTPTFDAKFDSANRGKDIASYDRSNNYGTGDLPKDEFSSDKKPEQQSVNRRHLKPHAAPEHEDSNYGDIALRQASGGRRHAERRYEPLFNHGYDEEEMAIDKLLMHYSRKGRDDSANKSSRTRTKLPPLDHVVEAGETRKHQNHGSESAHPPSRALSLPQETARAVKGAKAPLRAASMDPDMFSPNGGRVHPRLPDYDELAARFNALKRS